MVSVAMGQVFDQFIALNRTVFEARQFSAAYHALTAAYYVAVDLECRDMITVVVTTAQCQSDWIDSHAPMHPHSSLVQTAQPDGVLIYRGLIEVAKRRLLIFNLIETRKNRKPS